MKLPWQRPLHWSAKASESAGECRFSLPSPDPEKPPAQGRAQVLNKLEIRACGWSFAWGWTARTDSQAHYFPPANRRSMVAPQFSFRDAKQAHRQGYFRLQAFRSVLPGCDIHSLLQQTHGMTRPSTNGRREALNKSSADSEGSGSSLALALAQLGRLIKAGRYCNIHFIRNRSNLLT